MPVAAGSALIDNGDGTFALRVVGATGAALGSVVVASGSAVIGQVGIDQTTPGTTDSVTTKSKGFSTAKLAVTRPNDTAAYGAGDVIAASTGATGIITLAGIGPTTGGEVFITSAIFERDVAALISGETTYTLHIYNTSPGSALGDNAAFDLPSGDRVAYLGKISLGTPVDLGNTLFVGQDGINKQVTVPSGGSLFGYIVTDGAYTPAATTVHRIQLHSVGV